MTIKEIVAQVRAKLPAEASAEIGTLLSEIEREGNTLLADRTAANHESSSRKEKIRELTANIETLNTEITTAKTDLETEKKNSEGLTQYKTKWETDKVKRDEANAAKWTERAKIFDLKETDDGYEQIGKVKVYYKFGEELTPDEITANLAKAAEHEALGLFKDNKQPPPGTPGKQRTNNSNLKEVNFGY